MHNTKLNKFGICKLANTLLIDGLAVCLLYGKNDYLCDKNGNYIKFNSIHVFANGIDNIIYALDNECIIKYLNKNKKIHIHINKNLLEKCNDIISNKFNIIINNECIFSNGDKSITVKWVNSAKHWSF